MSNKTILFADDSATMRTIMERTFRAEPFSVTTVPSGEAAIMKARELRPDIIIADAGMAGVSGYDVCKAVRDDSSLSNTPFIIMAGVSSPYDEARGREVGIDEYVKKPFDTTQLIEKVAELSSKPRAGKAPAAVGAAERVQAMPPVPSFGRPLTEKPAVAPAGPRPIATPIAVSAPHREPVFRDSQSDSFESEMSTPADIEEIEREIPEAEPIELSTEAEPIELSTEAEPASFQVSTLAELAQMDEKGGQIAPEVREDAIELPEPRILQLEVPEPIADSLEPPTEPYGISPVSTSTRSLHDKTSAAFKSMGMKFDGLSEDQVKAIVSLSTEVVERVVWEVVPDLAEAIIKEELAKLLKE